MITGLRALLISAAVLAAPVAAQSAVVASAMQTGQIGERFDGYMGFVTAPSPELRRQVAAINLRRRNLYIQLASQKRVSADAVGMATACELFSALGPGQSYMLQDGSWRRIAPGQRVPVPAYCG